jgi:heme/copper-type cytochrome/quinol oxidase subunit 2
VLATISMLLIDDEGVARPVTLVAMALLGVALVLGCLFAFPYAGVWRHDHADGEAAAETTGAAPKQDPAFINDIRTMLISIVVGVFALVTIYLTYVSAQAAAQSAEATGEQQKFDRLSTSAT